MSRTFDTFFETYRAAFEAFDAVALSGFFTYPCQITSDSGDVQIRTIASRDDYVETIRLFLKTYTAACVSSGRITDTHVRDISDNLAIVTLRWDVLGADGSRLYSFRATYTLVRVDREWRIAAIAHDELSHLKRILGSS